MLGQCLGDSQWLCTLAKHGTQAITSLEGTVQTMTLSLKRIASLFWTRWSQLWLASNSITHLPKNSPQSKNQMHMSIMRWSSHRVSLKGRIVILREGPPCGHSVVYSLLLSVILSATSCLLNCHKMQMEPSSPTLWDTSQGQPRVWVPMREDGTILVCPARSSWDPRGCQSDPKIPFIVWCQYRFLTGLSES